MSDDYMGKYFPDSEEDKFTDFAFDFYVTSRLYDSDLILQKIRNLEHCRYAYILHDSCRFDDGKPKEPHYHCVLKFENPRVYRVLRNNLGIPYNHFGFCKDYKLAMQYLTHMNYPNKTQYDWRFINTNITDISKFFVKSDYQEGEAVRLIMNYITEFSPSLKELVYWCLDNNLYSHLRRGKSLFSDVLREERESRKIESDHHNYELDRLETILRCLREQGFDGIALDDGTVISPDCKQYFQLHKLHLL